MKIYDEEQNLLVQIIKPSKNKESKNFYTSNEQEFQIASFKLNKSEVILRHYHKKQERKINKTSEVIILNKGNILLSVYDLNLNKIEEVLIEPGDIIAMFDGGHELTIIEDAEFIEVKQGPYDEQSDKTRF